MKAEANQPLEPDYDPNMGGVGLLTWDQFDRFTRAVNDARNHVPWWRIAGHIRAGDADEMRTRSNDPTIPLPATWLAAEEITNLLHEINYWPTLEAVAKFGHEFALLLTREVETAMHKWPMSDRPHRVRFLRCRACELATLKYFPPREGGADMEIRCTNRECRAIEDPRNFAHDAALIMEEYEIAKRRVGNRKRRPRESEPVETDNLFMGQGGAGEDVEAGTNVVALSA